MIQFSCADYTFPLLPPARRFALLELLRFRYVDIGLFERSSGFTPRELAANPKSFTRRLKSELNSTSLRVSDIFLQTGMEPSVAAANDPNPQVRARNHKMFMLALDLCVALGCKHLTGLPGVWHAGVGKADDLAVACEEAAWRWHAASEAGVTYAIEAHVGSICPDVTGARAFVESVPGLTLTLDYGHFVFANTLSRDVHTLLPLASHIHMRAAAPGRLQSPIAENRIDFAGMVRRLHKQKYRGYLAIEYVWTEWQQCNRTDNLAETILLRRLLQDLDKEA